MAVFRPLLFRFAPGRWLRALMSLLLASSVSAAPPVGDASGFDRERALAISQAAINKELQDYSLLASDGRSMSLADYRGKPLVINLIFTSCSHICPATTQQLQRGVRHARAVLGENSFSVLTVGFDTANDTAQAMASYRKKLGIADRGWDFAAADRSTIQAFTESLGFQFRSVPNGFDHLVQTTIVDENGKVYRQVYGVHFPVPHFVEPLKELVFKVPADSSMLEELTTRIRLFCTVYDPASDSYRFDYSIFVGLVVGLSLGCFFLFVVLREWRYSAREAKRRAQSGGEL